MALTFSERREITRQLRESFEIAGGGIVYQNDGNNRVVTGDGSGGIQAETNLLFDGSELDVVGDATTNNLRIGDNTSPTSRLSIAAEADVSTTIVNITNNSGTDAIKFDIDGSNIPGLVLNTNGRIETTGNSNQLYLKSDGTVSLSNTDGSAKLDLGTETGSLNDVKPHLVAKAASSNFPIEIASILGTGGNVAEQYFSINATVDSANATYAAPKFVGGTGGGYVFRVHSGRLDIGKAAAGSNNDATQRLAILSNGSIVAGAGDGGSNTLNVSQSSDLQLYLESTDAITTADMGPAINFYGTYTTGGDITQYGVIKTHKENTTTGETGTEMSFSTRPNGGSITEAMRITSDGNVGIGTDSPSTSMDVGLHIKTTAGNSLILEKSSGAALQFRSDAATIRATIAGINGADGLAFQTGAAQTERMRINSDGDVGIGTDSPKDKLHIKIGTDLNWQFGYPNNSVTTLAALNDAESAYVTARIDAGTLELNGQSGGDVNLGAGVLVVDTSADRVGINTASPAAPIEINASGNTHLILKYQDINTQRSFIATNAGVSTAYNGLVIGSNATEQGTQANTGLSSWYQRLGSTDASGDAWSVAYQASGGSVVELARITSDGNVGIRTSSPNFPLQVMGEVFAGVMSGFETAGKFYLGRGDGTGTDVRYHYIEANNSTTDSSNYLSFNVHTGATTTSTAEVLRLQGNGNVGIGTDNPQALLQVKGENTLVASTGYRKTWVGGAGTWGADSYEELGVGYSGIRSIHKTGSCWDLQFTTGDSSSFVNGTQSARMTITCAGFVGIGETNPASKLHLSDGAFTQKFTSTSTNALSSVNAGVRIQNLSDTDNNFAVGTDFFNSTGFVTGRFGAIFRDAGDRNTDLYWATRANSAALVSHMFLTSAGRLGIGCCDPQNTLHLQATNAGIRLQEAGQTYYSIVRANGDGLYLGADDGNTGGTGADIRFNVEGSEKFRICSNGNMVSTGGCFVATCFAGNATSAGTATSATNATFATSAGSATNATFANAATNATNASSANNVNTQCSNCVASTVVCRDGSGNFAAGTITANITGSAASATNATFANSATNATFATSATNASAATNATFANAATNATNASSANNVNTQCSSCCTNTVVCRDGSGNFAAGTITANITGSAGSATNATFANVATNATFATSAGSATNATFATSAGSATNATFANSATNATNAASANNVNTQCSSCCTNTVVCRDGSGNFAAGTITANITGSAASATNATFANSATNATFANSATSATNAGTANNVNTQCSNCCTNTVVCRDGSGNFAAGTITANITGSAGSATNATFANVATNATFANAATNASAATNATFATSATNATFATSATNATNASSANNVNTQCSCNVASTVVCRDASGNFKAADPTASDHVATKNYVDTEIANAGPPIDNVSVRVIGAGGGGGSGDGVCSGSPCFGGGGGGGGGGIYCDDNFAVEDLTKYSVTVGSGGVGATVANASGAVGGSSQFNGVTAFGGGGGGGKTNTYIQPSIDPCLNGASGGGGASRASNTQNLGGNPCTAPSPGVSTKQWCYGQVGSYGGRDTGTACLAGGSGAGLTTGDCRPGVYADYRASCFRTTGLAWSDGSHPGNGGHGAITGWDDNTVFMVGAGGAGSSCDRPRDPSYPTGIMGQYKCTTLATYCSNICEILENVGSLTGKCWGDGGSGGNNSTSVNGPLNPNAGDGKHGAVVFCFPYPSVCFNGSSYPGVVNTSYVNTNASCVACLTSGSGQICFSVT